MIFINKKQRYTFYLLFLTFLSADIKIFCETPINSPQEITNTSGKDDDQKNSTENHKDKNVKKTTTKSKSTSLSSQLFYLTNTLIIGATSLITGGITYLILTLQATENQSTLDKKLHDAIFSWLYWENRNCSYLERKRKIEAIIENGANVNTQSESGETALHKVFEWGFIFDDQNIAKTIKFLVEHGANVNAQDQYGETPLHKFTTHYHTNPNRLKEGIKALIKHGADVNKKDKTGKTALDLIFYRRRPLHYGILESTSSKRIYKIAKILCKHKAKVSDEGNPLHEAIKIGFNIQTDKKERRYSLKLADLLVKNGSNPNKKEKHQGNTPFHKAAKHFNIQEISNLISQGAKMNTKNNIGITPATIISKRFGYLKTLALYKEQWKYRLRSYHSKIIKKSKAYIINKIANLK